MRTRPILEYVFYHDGRGPELLCVRWGNNGVTLRGFEYYNPDDEYIDNNLKNIKISGIQVYSMTTEEVHSNILASGESRAAILEVVDSAWLKTYRDTHLGNCKHYQIMFYDEIYDVVCEAITPGTGELTEY